MPFNGDRLRAAAGLGAAELRGAYNDRRRKIELKASQKRQLARTRIEREKIKAQKDKEMADLEREMYEAKIAAQQARARARDARLRAGVYTPGEQLGRLARGAAVFSRGAAQVSGEFYRGLTTGKPPRKTGRKTTKRRTTR